MWKTIPFEDNYEVSSAGEIRNKNTKHVKSLRMGKSGYLRATLYPSGKTYNIHQLVAKTYLQKDKEGLVVNHKDGNKLNNKLENLEWVSASYNCVHAYKNKLNTNKPSGKKVVVPKDLIKRIRYGDLRGVCKYELSERFGFHWVTFRDVINGKTYKNV
jgi:hypothetical protein